MGLLKKLSDAIDYIGKSDAQGNESIGNTSIRDTLDEIVKEGLIQRFENTHELA